MAKAFVSQLILYLANGNLYRLVLMKINRHTCVGWKVAVLSLRRCGQYQFHLERSWEDILHLFTFPQMESSDVELGPQKLKLSSAANVDFQPHIFNGWTKRNVRIRRGQVKYLRGLVAGICVRECVCLLFFSLYNFDRSKIRREVCIMDVRFTSQCKLCR